MHDRGCEGWNGFSGFIEGGLYGGVLGILFAVMMGAWGVFDGKGGGDGNVGLCVCWLRWLLE